MVRTFLSRSVDALILSPNEDDGADIVTLASERELPVVTLDREGAGAC